MVDTSSLNHILSINTTTRTALCEPNVPMDTLVAACIPHNLVPPVVMEFPGITVGGGFAGTGGESSSFRYGFFDRTVNWIEIVIADGTVVRASKEDNEDLYFGAASSFGTLGVATLLEISLIPAKKFVELTYVPVDGMESAVKEIEKVTKDENVDYVDGIMFGKDDGVVCVGRLTDDVARAARVTRFTRRADPWFYIHAERLWRGESRREEVVEAIPLTDYLFRCKLSSIASSHRWTFEIIRMHTCSTADTVSPKFPHVQKVPLCALIKTCYRIHGLLPLMPCKVARLSSTLDPCARSIIIIPLISAQIIFLCFLSVSTLVLHQVQFTNSPTRRPRRFLGCEILFQILPYALQPHHALHPRLLHAHKGNVPRPPPIRALLKVYHSRRRHPAPKRL